MLLNSRAKEKGRYDFGFVNSHLAPAFTLAVFVEPIEATRWLGLGRERVAAIDEVLEGHGIFPSDRAAQMTARDRHAGRQRTLTPVSWGACLRNSDFMRMYAVSDTLTTPQFV